MHFRVLRSEPMHSDHTVMQLVGQ